MSLSKITIPVVTPQVQDEVTLVQIPSGITFEERVSVVACLLSTLNRKFPSQRSAAEVVYNLFLVALPDLSSAPLSASSVKLRMVAPSTPQLFKWAGLEPDEATTPLSTLPPLPGPLVPEAAGVTNEVAVYASLAAVLFSMGRQASESARASIMDNRPDALIRRFEIPETDQILMPGRSAGPSREVLEQVYNAFASYAELKSHLVSYFIGLRRSGLHLPIHLEALMTNFQLMRGAGMTHVDAIIKLVRMHPWTLRHPSLVPFYARFMDDLEKFEEVPEDIRPYHRLLVAQGEFLFLSSDLRPLIAVAGSFIEEVEKTFGGYVYNRAAYQALIDEVHSHAPNFAPTSGLSRLATLLGVKEEPLPPKAQSKATPESSTV